jgi:tetratricopeptide (TPR) repeat protein
MTMAARTPKAKVGSTRRSLDLASVQTVVERQQALGRRLLWLFLLPFAITAAVVPVFFILNARLSDVEIANRVFTIERFLTVDRNMPWAIHEYESVAQSRPSAQVFARLGILYFLDDPTKEKKAIELLEKAKQYDPNYWEIYRSLTYIHTTARRSKEAIEAGEKAISLNDFDANTFNNLAWIYVTCESELRNFHKAETYGRKAVELTKEKNGQFLDTLAEVYHQIGNLDQTRSYLQKAILVADVREIDIFRGHFKSIFPSETVSSLAESTK